MRDHHPLRLRGGPRGVLQEGDGVQGRGCVQRLVLVAGTGPGLGPLDHLVHLHPSASYRGANEGIRIFFAIIYIAVYCIHLNSGQDCDPEENIFLISATFLAKLYCACDNATVAPQLCWMLTK